MLARVLLALVFVLATVVACAPEPFEFVCESDVQCDDGNGGTCVQMWCSYPDATCDSGLRFSQNAGADLGGVCVDPDVGSEGGDG